MLYMEKMPFPYGAEPGRPTDDDRDPKAIAPPAISTAVTLGVAFVLGWLVIITSTVCGSECHSDRNEPTFSLIFKVCCGYGLVVPAGLLLVCWLLPWRRRHSTLRLATAVLAPFSLGALYVLFNVWLALA